MTLVVVVVMMMGAVVFLVAATLMVMVVTPFFARSCPCGCVFLDHNLCVCKYSFVRSMSSFVAFSEK